MFRTVMTLVWSSVLILLVHIFLWQPTAVPTTSMRPVLLPGDYLFVSKYAYGYSRHSLPFGMPLITGRILFTPPERGDVVAFKRPFDDDNVHFERIIGFPGEIVQVRDGILHINDRPVGREPIEGSSDGFIEKLPNGRSYAIATSGADPVSETPVYLVRDGQYLVMGDNRASGGARPPSFVPKVNLLGRAAIIFASVDHAAGSLRTDRLFTHVE